MDKHPHRLSDPTAVSADATVEPGHNSGLREVLRLNRSCGDLELVNGSSKTGPEKLEPKGTRGKAKLSDKYLAGLIDADGCITFDQRRLDDGLVYVYPTLVVTQKAGPEFISLVANSLTPPSLSKLWGCFSTKPDGTLVWRVNGRKAISVLMRLKKYLVLKRSLAELAIEINAKPFVVGETDKAIEAAKLRMPNPKHHTRKWAAGYIDGDGCFAAMTVNDGRMSASIRLIVDSEAFRRVGIDLLYKAWGGSIREYVSPYGTPMVKWTLVMDAAKLRSIFESGKDGIAKHMVLKADQVYFLLGCAKMGHFRDGERIRDGLASVKGQPHRLSGPGACVSEALSRIRDVPDFRGDNSGERKRQWEQEQSCIDRL